MTKKPLDKDPNAQREAQKYENPIPSREYIMELLGERGTLNREQIAATLKLTSDEQREEFINEFRMLLIRTYSTALLEYSNQTIDYLPVRAAPEATDVTVRTQIKRADGPSIPISYDLYNNDGHWFVYDVTIDHVSLVSNYRSSFASQMRRRGFDALISQLQSRNSALKK